MKPVSIYLHMYLYIHYRSGIKCIGVEPVEDTDDSDWQGF